VFFVLVVYGRIICAFLGDCRKIIEVLCVVAVIIEEGDLEIEK